MLVLWKSPDRKMEIWLIILKLCDYIASLQHIELQSHVNLCEKNIDIQISSRKNEHEIFKWRMVQLKMNNWPMEPKAECNYSKYF